MATPDEMIETIAKTAKGIAVDSLIEGYKKYPDDIEKRFEHMNRTARKLFFKWYNED